MFWKTLNFFKLIKLLLPTFLRKNRIVLLLTCCIVPLDRVYNETLYKMQHDGRTIYLEKMLNEWFEIVGYNPTNHELTKKIIINDLPEKKRLYIYQDNEPGVSFLKDVDSPNDVFLELENENDVSYSWIIFIPSSINFNEAQVRTQVDQYRYFGKKYIIQPY